MNMTFIDKVLTNMKDYHLPICLVMFFTGAGMSWFHHLDMNFVAYAGTILGAITGHAFSSAAKDNGDKKEDNPDKAKSVPSDVMGFKDGGEQGVPK
jgi:hypothetical protein